MAHWLNNNANYNPEAQPSVVLPEEFRGNTKIQPSVPVPQSGRIRATEKQYAKKFPQFEDIHGRPFVHPVAPKRPEITLASIKSDLERTYAELTSSQESYELNKNVPDNRASDLRSAILVLEQQLANRHAELERVIMEGTVAQKAAKAINKAERATAALSAHTVDVGAAQDALSTFRAQIKLLPAETRKALAVRHTQVLRELFAGTLIKLVGDEKLTASQVSQHFERVHAAIEKLGNYISTLEEEAK
jgi:hypothetical protein